MNYRDIIVFDFETGGRNPHKCQPTQIAAVAIHARKLTLQPGGTFNSEMRPILNDDKAIAAGFDPVEDEALDITRKTRAALAKAPLPKQSGKSLHSSVTNTTSRRLAGLPLLQLDIISMATICLSLRECVKCTGLLTKKEADKSCSILYSQWT